MGNRDILVSCIFAWIIMMMVGMYGFMEGYNLGKKHGVFLGSIHGEEILQKIGEK